jgi:hypothetical protein
VFLADFHKAKPFQITDQITKIKIVKEKDNDEKPTILMYD